MNKIERLTRALRNEDVDRPPFSFWYHFGLQHMPGRIHAQAQLDFYREYDLDFLKVMNDYPYPLPGGLDAIETADDWRRVEPVESNAPCWADQFSALEMIADSIGKEAMFIETVFSPWTTARRLTRSDGLATAIRQHPELLLAALDAIATSLARYSTEVMKRGASGIFLSLGAASEEVMTSQEYETWGRPFDLRIVEAVRDAPFNVLHIHGRRIHFESVMDYPVSALNWSHFATAPSLSEGKARSNKPVLGGINEATVSQVSPSEMRDQIASAIREVGKTGLILTPGCSVPTDTRKRNLQAIGAAARLARDARIH